MAVYNKLLESGELKGRVEAALEILSDCHICPRNCQVNRIEGKKLGKCRTGRYALVSSYGPHHGEEVPLRGWGGSGTIFFTHCNLRCVFCQNYTISQIGEGWEASPGEIAQMMLSLQDRGCHNINLVSPTHVVPQILEALEIAATQGLTLPLVYNTGGYDSLETLHLLDGIVDIYMPDMKYSDEMTARRHSGIMDYPQVNKRAVKEMHRQVGDLKLDERGIAARGLLVRHLVLPNSLAGTKEALRFLAEEVSTNTYLNLMAQYYPAHRAFSFPKLSRPISSAEYREAVEMAYSCGLHRLDGAERPHTIKAIALF
ncbi:MAG: radical SAM protein [Chloroflexi bacterium]|nr:radical SAM protein [Chloroflexota bacterium]